MTTTAQDFSAPVQQGQDTELKLYSPQDAAKEAACCPATAKRIADELHLPVIRTVGGVRLFSRHQVERIIQERDRRAQEYARR